MSDQLTGLETKIDRVVKDAPFQLPEKTRKAIVEYMPWVALFIGVLSLWASYALWNLAKVADRYIDLGNNLSRMYGGSEATSTSHLSAVVWVGILLLAVEGAIYLFAYPKLKLKNKTGWNLLFYGALVNLAHGIIMLFDSYNGGVGRLISTLLSSAVGLYFLFQIRAYYLAKKS